MRYESPFRIIDNSYDVWSQVHEHIMNVGESLDNMVIEACIKVGCVVDKDELEKALRYDRGQYEKGYADGKRDAKPHWVSVRERLPKETKLVVTYGKSRVSFGYNLLLYDADTDKEVVEWFDYCGNRENVTHWMPLPEPPQEENK